MDKLLQQQYLKAMGVQAWQLRHGEPAPVVPQVPMVEVAEHEPVLEKAAATTSVPLSDWPALQSQVTGCVLCELHNSRTQTVFGVGNCSADWLVIGEAPGKDEDLQGEPFVGRAGQLLNAMLLAMGLTRKQVYIANILKCRPPNNRDPRPEEVLQCQAYLDRQIALIQPKLILTVGRIAAQNLLKTEIPIGKLRGQVHYFGPDNIPVIATYHPAYLLRSPQEKRKAWQDLQLAMRTLDANKL